MEKRRPSGPFWLQRQRRGRYRRRRIEVVEIKRMRTLSFARRRYPQGTYKFEVAHKPVLLGKLVLRRDEGE
ncbi:hypothetical protein FCV25MIE_19121, partial [Fagus crenata]